MSYATTCEECDRFLVIDKFYCDECKAQAFSDPIAVEANMLRGTLAMPTDTFIKRQYAHLFPADATDKECHDCGCELGKSFCEDGTNQLCITCWHNPHGGS